MSKLIKSIIIIPDWQQNTAIPCQKIQTNYGKFNIKYSGDKIWNSINESTKNLSKTKFKEILSKKILDSYNDNSV